MLDELRQVLRFFCPNLGCQHEQGEIYLSTSLLDSVEATVPMNDVMFPTVFLVPYP